MKNHRNLSTNLLLAAGMAVVAAPTLAEPGDCGPMGSWEKFHEQRSERMQQHQKRLHDALKLTPDQEGAWKKFTESMVPPPRPEKGEPEDWAKLTAPERAERMLELGKKRQERMADHLAALKTFYAVLTPEQKKIFDEHHAGPRGGKRGPQAPGGSEPRPAPPGPARG